jgi:broad specificity phosphatase PhoE
MESILWTQSWCGPAQSILEHTLKLSGAHPVIMHIRHTERERATPGGDPRCTEEGLKAAYEFGASLPTSRRYRVWHTVVERTRETCLAIMAGLESNQTECTLAGPIPVNTILDPAGFYEEQPRHQVVEDTDLSALTYLNHWLSGFYPPDMVRPSLEFAQMIARTMLEDIGEDSFHLLVSHDTWVAALMFHWFGLPPPRGWINFLDGFVVELRPSASTLITKEGVMETGLPDWLKKCTTQ